MGDTIIREVPLLHFRYPSPGATMRETGCQGRLDVLPVCSAPNEATQRFISPLVHSLDLASFLSAVDRRPSN